MSDNYKAIVCTLSDVRMHPNADRLKLADASGYQVIVGLDAENGHRGIVIGAGAQLSQEFALVHGLLRKDPVTGANLGGYLEESCRVRTMVLRGERSDGIFIDSESSADLSAQLMSYMDGDAIDSLDGFPSFVRKYETPAQLRYKDSVKVGQPKAPKGALPNFPKHYDTQQVRHNLRLINSRSGQLIVTEKIHGTSARTGYIEVDLPQNRITRFWNKLAPGFLAIKPKREWQRVSGTRNVLLRNFGDGEASKPYRQQAHDFWASVLPKGVVVYYELAGYETSGRPIMARHTHDGESLNYPNPIEYSYGCDSEGASIADLCAGTDDGKLPQCKIFLYRATDELGELPFDRLAMLIPFWAREFAQVVPVIPTGDDVQRIERDDPSTHLTARHCDELASGCSYVDDMHPMEGICVRVDTDDEKLPSFGRAFKYKSFVFNELEGNAANDPTMIDQEDIA